MLVRAVVRAGAVLVFPAVLMTGWQAVFVAVVASGTLGMHDSGGRGLMMHGTITQHTYGRLRERTHHEQQAQKCGEATAHLQKAKAGFGYGQAGLRLRVSKTLGWHSRSDSPRTHFWSCLAMIATITGRSPGSAPTAYAARARNDAPMIQWSAPPAESSRRSISVTLIAPADSFQRFTRWRATQGRPAGPRRALLVRPPGGQRRKRHQ